MRSARPIGLAGDRHFAFIGQMSAAEHLQQRTLPGAVLANQGEHFAARNGKRDIVKCLSWTKPLADPSHFKQRGRHSEALSRGAD